jgi:amidase
LATSLFAPEFSDEFIAFINYSALASQLDLDKTVDVSLSEIAKQTRFIDGVGQAELVATGKVSASELLEAAIERYSAFNPSINAINITWFDHARELAKKFKPSVEKKFGGVPFVLKDLGAPYAGQHMSNGNIALKNAKYIAPSNSNLVQKFIDSGLITFGRTNSPEFGSVPVTEPLAWGPTRNPFDVNRTSGGSSGGSAAAVAAGIVPFAHASDGGGSIRIPAACCGLVGLKTSQGRISLAPFGDEANFSVHFAVTRTVRDAAALLDAVHGPGVGDRVIAPAPSRPYVQEVGADPGKLRIGYIDHHMTGAKIDAECVQAVRDTCKLLESLGHSVENSWPTALDNADFAGKFTAMWSTNMSVGLNTLAQMLGRPVTKDDVELMNWTMAEYAKSKTATDYAQAVYLSMLFRRAVQQWWADGWDLLITPTTSQLPLSLGTIRNMPEDPMAALRIAGDWIPLTPPFNTSGQPAINVPLQWTSDGIPVGVQIVAAYGREDLLIRVASQLETAQPWAKRTPTL